ncbi:hypothetical protein Tco_0183956 [Tanacetum coccineum]
MTQLEFCDKHNMVAYLVKSESSEGFDEIIDFLISSHIYYALIENPIIFVSLIEQFWETAILSTTEEGLQAISATIDGHEQLTTEASLRRHLKLEDAEGISSLSNEEIFEHLAHMGYVTNSESLTFFKEETAFMPHDSPFYAVHLHGSVEGSVQQHDLMVLVTKLQDRINGLEKDLHQTKKIYSTALTKLVLRVKKLEYKLKSGKARRKAKIVLSDDEEIAEDSSKQGRKISQINEDLMISLVQDEGISWILQDEEVHEKPSDETKVLVQEETPTEIIEEHRSGEKGEMKISTANIRVSTASPPKVSTVVPHVYTIRSAKDKGKDIMEEPATPKKVKKRTQVQLSMDEELARKMEEEERIRFNAKQEARALQEEEEEERLHLKAARELQRQLDQRQENKPVSIAQARRNMITYLKNQGVEEEKVKEEDVNPEPVLIEKKAVGIRRKTLARRRASDKQVPDEEEFVDPEVLHTKFPIVDWESQSLLKYECTDIAKNLNKTVKIGQIRTREWKRVHKIRENAIKSYTSPIAPIGGNPKGNDTRAKEKTHLSRGIYTKTYGKEAQRPLTHGLPR